MNNPVENGNNSLILSIVLSIFPWLDIDTLTKLVTAIGAVVGIYFASRAHIAAKKKADAERKLAEEELKKLKNE